jgi:outer membrane protein OmpA-like peptidoglycan-associated protein
MSLRAPDLPDTGGPFLFPAARTRTRQPDTLDLEGPFELGEVAVKPARSTPAIAGATASAAGSRARYANWSDADDRRKGRNPREQNIRRDPKVVAAAGPQGESKVLEFPMPGDVSQRLFLLHNFKIDGAVLRPEHKQYLGELAQWMRSRPQRDWQVFAEAHASRTGTQRHDDVLSEDRYLVTRAFLESQLLQAGVDATRLRIFGEGVGFRHSPLPGEDPRARSVYVVVQPNPSARPPTAWPPAIVPVSWPPAQPRPTPVPVPAVPAALPSAWLGIDRREIVKTATGGSRASQMPTSADAGWFGLLMDNSNLRLCGAYLEGTSFPTGSSAGQFTRSTKDVPRGWIPNVTTLRAQGWGTMFYYVGHSVHGGEPLPSTAILPTADYAARGRLHALHAKTIVGSLAALDGAVVFFDNEDGEDTVIASLLPYYNAFFDELARPGPGALPALRPGLYAHNKIARQFLVAHPELFVLEVQFDTATTTTTQAPFTANARPLAVDASTRPLHPMAVNATSGTPSWFAWPVARQFRSYTGNMPAGPPLASIPGLRAVPSWDYNSAPVRDPAYPHGEPRLAVAVDAAGTAIVRGVFAARAATTAACMAVDLVDSRQRQTTTLPACELVEPDAPIASATFPGMSVSRLATILQSNNVGVCDTSTRTWSSTGSATAVVPRRLRALAMAAFGVDDFQAFFIGNDRALYAIRSLAGDPWSAPVRMGSPLLVHPFAQVAATSRAANSVDVFAINEAGQLSTMWWSPRDRNPVWPGTQLLPLEAGPSVLFPHTALAAVSPLPSKLLVFAVGKDLRLRLVQLTNTAWSPIQTLGGVTDVVSPHARIAVHAPGAARVEVAVTTDTGKVRVHSMAGAAGRTWTETLPAVELPDPEPAAPPGFRPPAPSALTEPAFGWRINPFGDLAIGTVDGITMVFAAGIRPGATTALRRSLAAGGKWERYR